MPFFLIVSVLKNVIAQMKTIRWQVHYRVIGYIQMTHFMNELTVLLCLIVRQNVQMLLNFKSHSFILEHTTEVWPGQGVPCLWPIHSRHRPHCNPGGISQKRWMEICLDCDCNNNQCRYLHYCVYGQMWPYDVFTCGTIVLWLKCHMPWMANWLLLVVSIVFKIFFVPENIVCLQQCYYFS